MGEVDASLFEVVGRNYKTIEPHIEKPSKFRILKEVPWISTIIFVVVVLGCIFAPLFCTKSPSMYYLDSLNVAPCSDFLFGTDSLGRDLFSVIWYGGRASLIVGIFGTVLITVIGIGYGCINGLVGTTADMLMQRFVEMFHSIPMILMAILLAAIMGKQNVLSISLIIALTSWFALARIVRSEVRQIRLSDYVIAARCSGSSLVHLIRVHLIPNIIPAIMFVVISSVGSCITTESTLSFLGLGLPLDVLSWGSILSLADRALLLNTWWVIIIPGVFLVVTLTCITIIANKFRKNSNRKPNRL